MSSGTPLIREASGHKAVRTCAITDETKNATVELRIMTKAPAVGNVVRLVLLKPYVQYSLVQYAPVQSQTK